MGCNDKYKSKDITSIVFFSIVIVLGITLLGLTGKYYGDPYHIKAVSYVNFPNGAWALLTGIIHLAASLTTNTKAYGCSIAMHVISILAILGTITLTGLTVYRKVYSPTVVFTLALSFLSGRSLFGDPRLVIGLLVVNCLGFILMIAASCVVCCSTCGCNRQNTEAQPGQTIVVGYPTPGYVQMPPNNQQYAMQSYNQNQPQLTNQNQPQPNSQTQPQPFNQNLP